MNDCLIVTTLADEFAREVARLSGGSIRTTACSSVDAARQAYAGEKVLFGSPGMIAELIDELRDVEWVQSSWAGVTPLIESGRRDYVLTGVKGVFGPQMAEYTLGYLLGHELKIIERRDAQARHEWFGRHSGTLFGKTLGIMGTGSIGSEIARAARAFAMDVTGFSRSGALRPGFSKVHGADHLQDFLVGLDYLVSTLPATKDTDGLLDADAFASLPDHAVLVNVGRGNVVDDDALVAALRDSRLAAAVLDVFDEEPLPDSSPLWDAPGVSITAHVAAISHPLLIVPVFVENFSRYRDGSPLNYKVDFSSGY